MYLVTELPRGQLGDSACYPSHCQCGFELEMQQRARGSLLDCAGTNGSYTVTPGEDAGLSSLFMRYPPSCGGNGPADTPSMTSMTGAFLEPESVPPGALWQLPLTQQSASISAYGYPLTQCNADFTQCAPLTP